MQVEIDVSGHVWTVILNRPERKNAVDRETADLLAQAFRRFDQDASARVAVLWGRGGTFCAGADLTALAQGRGNRLDPDPQADGPMGPTRLRLTKPVIAAVAGYAVAGGLELACWCDLRVAEEDAVFGVYSRRYGVPLIDGGTQRLPRLICQSRALDMILTGRSVQGTEAEAMGLVNYLAEPGRARYRAEDLAQKLARFPQTCLRSDRQAVIQGVGLPLDQALALEFALGLQVIESGESRAGAERFVQGRDRELP